MQFFYLLCSQFRQKASSWINKTLLLIKQHITYMNISRYANIDKFVNIQYIFLLAHRAYSWLFQLAQMWKLLAPGVGLVDFWTPGIWNNIGCYHMVVGFTPIYAISPYLHYLRFEFDSNTLWSVLDTTSGDKSLLVTWATSLLYQ
jgi:hypothetical protein